MLGYLFAFIVLLFLTGSGEAIMPVIVLALILWALRNRNSGQLESFRKNLSQFETYINAQAAETSRTKGTPRRGAVPADEEDYTPADPIYRHALHAVKEAGLDPERVQVLTVDIGMLAYKGNEQPRVYRTWTVPDDVDYVQPFVQLRLPSKAVGKVRFEILDSSGRPVFIREDNHSLVRGRNLISSTGRLAIHDQREMEGNWQLRVSADGVLLALHKFEFADSHSAKIRSTIGEDGELNTELRLAMAESKLPKLSLEELLAHQEVEDTSPRQARRQ